MQSGSVLRIDVRRERHYSREHLRLSIRRENENFVIAVPQFHDIRAHWVTNYRGTRFFMFLVSVYERLIRPPTIAKSDMGWSNQLLGPLPVGTAAKKHPHQLAQFSSLVFLSSQFVADIISSSALLLLSCGVPDNDRGPAFLGVHRPSYLQPTAPFESLLISCSTVSPVRC
jgi:hypothetical protein